MELAEIKILIDKYYEGETTLQEEAALAEYFASHDAIPDDLEVTRAIFMATNAMHEIKSPEQKSRRVALGHRMIFHIGGAVAAAVVLCGIFLGLRYEFHATTPEPAVIACYKDGIAIESEAEVMAEANRILGGVSEDMQLAMAKIESLNILSIH